MHKLRFALSVLAGALFAMSAVAQPSERDAALGAKQVEQLSAIFAAKTGMKADAMAKAPVPGFIEVVVGTSVFYMDPTGKWLLDGHLVDLDTRTSVTALKKHALESADKPAMDWSTLSLTDAIKTVRGTAVPGRVLVTFEDPNCGFCKKLAPELEKLPNLTVYTFPVSILGEGSKAKNEALWCAKDRVAAWKSTLGGAEPKGATPCDVSGLRRNADLAAKLKVTGTPTIFFADGSRIPGFMDASAIEKRLVALPSLSKR